MYFGKVAWGSRVMAVSIPVTGNTGVTHPHSHIYSFLPKHCGLISHSLSSLIHYRRQVNNQEKKKAFILDLGYGSDLISCS